MQFETQLEEMDCHDPDHAALRGAILRHAIDDPDNLQDHIMQTLGPEPLENLLALRHVAVIPCVYKPGDVEKAEMTLAEELAKIKALRGLDAEIAEAAEELSDLADEALTYRLAQAAEERNRTSRSQNEDRAVFDIADNGARINRDEKDAFEAITSGIKFERKHR